MLFLERSICLMSSAARRPGKATGTTFRLKGWRGHREQPGTVISHFSRTVPEAVLSRRLPFLITLPGDRSRILRFDVAEADQDS